MSDLQIIHGKIRKEQTFKINLQINRNTPKHGYQHECFPFNPFVYWYLFKKLKIKQYIRICAKEPPPPPSLQLKLFRESEGSTPESPSASTLSRFMSVKWAAEKKNTFRSALSKHVFFWFSRKKKQGLTWARWWFQPLWKILVNLDHLPKLTKR